MLKQSLLAVTLLSVVGCAADAPVLSVNPSTGFNTATLMNRFSAPKMLGNRHKYGRGAKIAGTMPMSSDDQGSGFAVRASLPENVDLRPQMPPIYHQGASGACVGFSTVGGLGEFLARRTRGINTRFSPRFLWNLGRKMEKVENMGDNDGMYLETAIKIMDNYGMVPESAFPFQTAFPANTGINEELPLFQELITQLPSNQLLNQAKSFRLSRGWQRIPSVHAMKKSLAEGLPVVFAIAVDDNLDHTGPNGLIPPLGQGGEIGGHAIVAVGYNNQKRHFIIRNSWGTEWGDRGYGYLPYDYFRAMVNAQLKEIPTGLTDNLDSAVRRPIHAAYAGFAAKLN